MVKTLSSIRSKRFDQESLTSDLQRRIAGQTFVFKVILLLLIVVFCALAVFLSGYVGGLISIYVPIDPSNDLSAPSPEFRATALIIVLVIAIAISQDSFRSVLAVILALGLAAISSIPLARLGFIQDPVDFSIGTLVATGFSLGTSSISFLILRFILALMDVLFIKSRYLKIAGVPIVILGGMAGSLVAIEQQKGADISPLVMSLLTSSEGRTRTLILGTAYSLSLAWSSWLSNVLRKTPWNHPSPQRFWALAVGSWWGTSFLNLDLSEVSFRGTTLANTDLRARKLYRTCFQGAQGLERARVDSQYLDLEIPKVQKLLTHASSADRNFRGLNLQGAYLQGADLRGFDLTDTNLTGADLKQADLRESVLVRTQLAGADFQGVDLRKDVLIDANLTEADFRGADLRDSILVRAQVARADFRGADLTGICIEDWSVSNKTRFADVRCDYIYRKYEDGQPTDCYPIDRDFEAGEFAYLYQESEDVVELVFKGEFDFSALSLAFYKLQTEMPELEFELKGIEQRETLWVVKAKTKGSVTERLIEAQLNLTYQATARESTVETTIRDSIYRDYEEIKARLAASEQLVNRLAGVTGDQAEALKELSKRSLGNSFFITGSTITNLAGSGQIEYTEAANQIRQAVTHSTDPKQVISTLQGLITQLNQQNVATTTSTQLELIQQVIGVEAEKDPGFKQFLIEQAQQVIGAMPKGAVATAVEAAIAQLRV
jgi:uncharacterized protein YjbI with pentapeptide repeats